MCAAHHPLEQCEGGLVAATRTIEDQQLAAACGSIGETLAQAALHGPWRRVDREVEGVEQRGVRGPAPSRADDDRIGADVGEDTIQDPAEPGARRCDDLEDHGAGGRKRFAGLAHRTAPSRCAQ